MCQDKIEMGYGRGAIGVRADFDVCYNVFTDDMPEADPCLVEYPVEIEVFEGFSDRIRLRPSHLHRPSTVWFHDLKTRHLSGFPAPVGFEAFGSPGWHAGRIGSLTGESEWCPVAS